MGLAADLWRATVEVLPELLRSLQSDELDYLVHDSLCPWGKAAAEILGLPRACSTTTFALSSSMAFRAKHLRDLMPPTRSLKAYGAFRSAAATLHERHEKLRPRLLDALVCDAPLNLVHTSDAIQPSAARFPQSHHFVGRRYLTGDAFPNPTSADALAYVSLGTIFNENPAFYRICFEALSGFAGRVLISCGNTVDIDALGSLPSNMTLERSVDQLAVLRRAQLFITHGGMNSVHEALYFGVPMVLVPQAADQHMVAQRVGSLGAGINLGGEKLTAPNLANAVRQVTAAGFAARSAELGATLHGSGGHIKAADLLQESLRLAR
jgi:MGT family glycosyltransferase